MILDVYPRVEGVMSLNGFETKPIVRNLTYSSPIFGMLLLGNWIEDPPSKEIWESEFLSI